MAKERPDTNIVLPRNYGIAVHLGSDWSRYDEERSTCLFYDPARYAIGLAILKTPAELQAALRQWQRYKQQERAELDQGILSYAPQFPIDGLEHLIEQKKWKDAEKEIIAGILKEEDSKNLWESGGKVALKHTKFYRGALQGDVRSKSKGYNHTYIGNPFLTSLGFIQHRAISCTKKGQHYEAGAKRLMSMCAHAAGQEQAQYLQLLGMRDFGIDYGRRKPGKLNPTLAFDFVSEKYLMNLVMDVLIARYVREESLYNINRKMMEGEIFDAVCRPALDNTARAGRVRKVVMKQKTKDDGRSDSYQTHENQWMRKVREKLRDEKGYRRMPFFTIAFDGSPFETFAERWENGDDVYEIAFFGDEAPILIRKRLEGEIRFHDSAEHYGGNPYLDMEKKGTKGNKSFDQCSSRDCLQRIITLDEVMSHIGMAEAMNTHYRGSIQRAGRKEAEAKRPKQPRLPIF